jgi:hypothetical protein
MFYCLLLTDSSYLLLWLDLLPICGLEERFRYQHDNDRSQCWFNADLILDY